MTVEVIEETSTVIVEETDFGVEITAADPKIINIVAEGPQGAAGVGVPGGGVTHSVLTKSTGANYDTEWKSLVAGSNVSIVNNSSAKTITISATDLYAGDVVGPSSSANNSIAVFDGNTGKAIKDSGIKLVTSNVQAGDMLVMSPAGTLVNKTQEQISADGSWLVGKPVLVNNLSNADLLEYHDTSNSWRNIKKVDLVDGGNF